MNAGTFEETEVGTFYCTACADNFTELNPCCCDRLTLFSDGSHVDGYCKACCKHPYRSGEIAAKQRRELHSQSIDANWARVNRTKLADCENALAKAEAENARLHAAFRRLSSGLHIPPIKPEPTLEDGIVDYVLARMDMMKAGQR